MPKLLLALLTAVAALAPAATAAAQFAEPPPRNIGPRADFRYDRGQGYEHSTILFDASGSSDPERKPLHYAWDFGADGSVEVSSHEPTTTWAFPKPGTHSVRLTVTDADGATSQRTRGVRLMSIREHFGPITGTPRDPRGPKRANPVRAAGRFTVEGDRTRVDAFDLLRVPKYTAITYRCDGPGCFRGRTLVAHFKGRGIFRWPLIGWTLHAGDVVSIRINPPGMVVKTIRVTARAGQQPLVR